MLHTNRHHFFPGFLGLENRFIFNNESLRGVEKKKKSEKLSVGDKIRKINESTAKHEKGIKNSPLLSTSLQLSSNPDSEIAKANEARTEGIANAVKGEDHQEVFALIMGNVPQQAGEKIAGNIMNDYT